MSCKNITAIERNVCIEDRISSWQYYINQYGTNTHPAFARLIKVIKKWINSGMNGADRDWCKDHSDHTYTPPKLTEHANGYCWIYAIVHKKQYNGLYVGRTTQTLYNRFWQHSRARPKKTDKSYIIHTKMMQEGVENFIIVGLERVKCSVKRKKQRLKIVLHPQTPTHKSTQPTNEQIREQVWQSKLDTLHHGYNRIRAVALKRLHKGYNSLIHNKKYDIADTHKHMIQQWHKHQHKLPTQFFERYADETLITLAENLTSQHHSESERQLGKTVLQSLVSR
jgi:hypothetical protein